jgi:plastocyanin
MSAERVRGTGRLDQVDGLETALAGNPARVAAGWWRVMAILLATLIAALGVAVSYGSAAASTSAGGGAVISTILPNTVVIKDFAFGPATMTVAPGTKIMVVNQDRAPHTVTAVNKAFDTGTISGGQRGEMTAPNTPGAYPYICTIHPSMTGTLIVK